MTTWPSPDVFPLPQVTFSGESGANVVRTRQASGSIQQRHRFRGLVTFVNVEWELTDELLETFIIFHKQNLNLGSDWFLLALPFTGVYVPTVVRFVEGRFQLSYVPVGHWMVRARLDVQSRLTLTVAELEDILEPEEEA